VTSTCTGIAERSAECREDCVAGNAGSRWFHEALRGGGHCRATRVSLSELSSLLELGPCCVNIKQPAALMSSR